MINKETLRMLDFHAQSVGIQRRKSLKKTKECPIYDIFYGNWIELDINFKIRVKKELCKVHD
jgi:hypothetical protein